MARKEATAESRKGGTNEIIGIGLFCLAMLLLLALFSFHKGDLAFNGTEINDPRHNLIGGAGAWVAQGCFLALGAAAYTLRMALKTVGIRRGLRRPPLYKEGSAIPESLH